MTLHNNSGDTPFNIPASRRPRIDESRNSGDTPLNIPASRRPRLDEIQDVTQHPLHPAQFIIRSQAEKNAFGDAIVTRQAQVSIRSDGALTQGNFIKSNAPLN